MTNGILLTDWKTRLAHKPFVESDSGMYTYAEAADYIAIVARSIRRWVADTQPIVPMLLSNSAEFVLILLGIMAAGKIPFPIQPTCKLQEYRAKTIGLNCQAAICDDSSFDLIVSAGLKPITLNVIQTVTSRRQDGAPIDRIDGEAKLMCATSGTTALPKRIVLQLGRMLQNAKAHAKSLGLNSTDRILSCLPFYHVFTLSSHIGSVIGLEATFIAGRDPLPQTISSMVKTHAVSYTSFVPAVLDAIVRNFDYELFNSPSLKRISIGSAPVSVKQIKQYKNFFANQDIYITYGLSEAGPRVSTLAVNQVSEELWDTVGLPLDQTDVRIVDPNEQGVGELQVKAPWQMLGYYGESTTEVWEAEWLKTGDLASLTADGYIRLQGRKKDLIISGGVNISPAEIEAALNSIPWVLEAAVLAVPDRKRGEVPHAFVVHTGDGTETEILRILRDQLDQIKVPKRVHFVDCIPKNATGKVDRLALLKSYVNRRFQFIEESA
jgi:acyl-CoA synthetase (AMP-forming)/AMP-acid ligase II